jgi:adenylate cyclase
MDFRIGINLGDVMVDGADLFGEGVNIASRLEGLATAGGICISGTAYDQVHNKLSLGYEFMGKQAVKNIAGEIPVYRIDLDGKAPSRRSRKTSAARAPSAPRPFVGPPPPIGPWAKKTTRPACQPCCRNNSPNFA